MHKQLPNRTKRNNLRPHSRKRPCVYAVGKCVILKNGIETNTMGGHVTAPFFLSRPDPVFGRDQNHGKYGKSWGGRATGRESHGRAKGTRACPVRCRIAIHFRKMLRMIIVSWRGFVPRRSLKM